MNDISGGDFSLCNIFKMNHWEPAWKLMFRIFLFSKAENIMLS